MAFVTINPALIEVGEPTRKELFQGIKDNLDDHESRISTAENAVNLPTKLDFEIIGNYYLSGIKTGLFYSKLITAITIQGVKLHQFKSFDSGTTEIDVLYKRGVDPFISIFSVRPTVTSANGDFYTSNNGIITNTDLLADDIIRIDLTATQSGGYDTHALTISLEYEVA